MNRASDGWLHGPAGLRLHPERRRVLAGDRPIHLTRTGFGILEVLLRRRGGVVSTADLVGEVWGFKELGGNTNFVGTAVYRLRRELRSARLSEVIETVRGVGYRIPEEADLARTEELKLAVLEHSATAVVVVDDAGRIQWANRAAERLTGYRLAELRALPGNIALVPPAKRPAAETAWDAVRSGGRRQRCGVELFTKAGDIIPVDGAWTPIDWGGFAVIIELWTAAETAEVTAEPEVRQLDAS